MLANCSDRGSWNFIGNDNNNFYFSWQMIRPPRWTNAIDPLLSPKDSHSMAQADHLPLQRDPSMTILMNWSRKEQDSLSPRDLWDPSHLPSELIRWHLPNLIQEHSTIFRRKAAVVALQHSLISEKIWKVINCLTHDLFHRSLCGNNLG